MNGRPVGNVCVTISSKKSFKAHFILFHREDTEKLKEISFFEKAGFEYVFWISCLILPYVYKILPNSYSEGSEVYAVSIHEEHFYDLWNIGG